MYWHLQHACGIHAGEGSWEELDAGGTSACGRNDTGRASGGARAAWGGGRRELDEAGSCVPGSSGSQSLDTKSTHAG